MNTQKRLEELRIEYKSADKERQKEILLLANKLKEPCIQCNNPKVEYVGMGSFCSEECRDKAFPLKGKVFNASQLRERIEQFKQMHYSKGFDSDQTVASAELIFNQKAQVMEGVGLSSGSIGQETTLPHAVKP